jgi:hypothetical protein
MMFSKCAVAMVMVAFVTSCVSTPPSSCGGASRAGAVLLNIIAADNVWAPPPPRPEVHGASAIQQSYERMYGAYYPRLQGDVATAVANDTRAVVTGHTMGTLVPQMTEVPSTQVHDEYEATLRCERGNWRVARLTWRPVS